ncbi:MAG: SEL1-like repeat protein [Comamonadaceae bacterium]|nr:SEL1-like repeat protein [Comamonadaceae bacterium]
MTLYLQTARSYLLSHQFDTCEAWLLGLHNEYLRDPDSEAEAAAMAAGASALRSIDEATAQWLRKSPDSYAALMMRGQYLWACGKLARGTSTANQVSQAQWALMNESFSEACRLFYRAALNVKNPGLALSMIGRMVWIGGDFVANGLSFPQGQDWYRYGLSVDPSSYALHAARLHSLRPEWGGSIQAMEKYLAAPEQASLTPLGRQRLARLSKSVLGFYRAMFQGERDAGRRLIDEAIALLPQDALAYYWRVLVDRCEGRHQDAIQYTEKALALDPEFTDILWEDTQARWAQDKNDPQILPQLKRLIGLGHEDAFLSLGDYLDTVLDEPGPAYDAWKKGADEGLALCALRLAEVAYGRGRGVKQDGDQSLFWFLRSYQLGWHGAVANAYWWVVQGRAPGYSLLKLAPTLIEAANVHDEPFSHGRLADAIEDQGLRYDESGKVWLTQVPLADDPQGIQLYLDHLTTAAENSHAYSQVKLAQLHRQGNLVGKSFEQAEGWLQQALEDGEGPVAANAKRLLAEMIQAGETKDSGSEEQVQAFQLLEEALEEAGEEDVAGRWALVGLARAYDRGLGVKKDRDTALKLAARAEKSGLSLPDDLKHLSFKSNHSESIGRSLLMHVIFGPIALLWAFLVGLFGKRFLGKVIKWSLLAALLLFLLFFSIGAYQAWKNPGARSTPASTRAPMNPEATDEKPTLVDRVKNNAEKRKAQEAGNP